MGCTSLHPSYAATHHGRLERNVAHRDGMCFRRAGEASNSVTHKCVSPAGLETAQDKITAQVALELCCPQAICRKTLTRGEKAIVLFFRWTN